MTRRAGRVFDVFLALAILALAALAVLATIWFDDHLAPWMG